jgi:hypothetical protein
MIVTSVAGLNIATGSAPYRFASPADLVIDVTFKLIYPFNSRHQLKEDALADAET